MEYVGEVAVRYKGLTPQEVEKRKNRVLGSNEMVPALGAATVFPDNEYHSFLTVDPSVAALLDPHELRGIAQSLVFWLSLLSGRSEAPFEQMCDRVGHRICTLVHGFTVALMEAQKKPEPKSEQ